MEERKVDQSADVRPQAEQRRRQQQEYGAWFRQFDWRFYVTATFDREVTGLQAWSVWDEFLDQVEREHKTPVPALTVRESKWSGLGKPSSGFHFHALLRAPEQVKPAYLEQLWATRKYGGRFCRSSCTRRCVCGECTGGSMRCCRYDSSGNAAIYLFKTVEIEPDAWRLHRSHLLGIKPKSWHRSGVIRDALRRHERQLRFAGETTCLQQSAT